MLQALIIFALLYGIFAGVILITPQAEPAIFWVVAAVIVAILSARISAALEDMSERS